MGNDLKNTAHEPTEIKCIFNSKKFEHSDFIFLFELFEVQNYINNI